MDDRGPTHGSAPSSAHLGALPGALSLVQFSAAAGVIDLAWGHPGSDLLPVDELRAAADRALQRYGPDALNYGAPAGPGPLLEWLAAHVGAIDGRAPAESELLVTGGASQGLDLVATVLGAPSDVWLFSSLASAASRWARVIVGSRTLMRSSGASLPPRAVCSHGVSTSSMARLGSPACQVS